jgi:5,10-methylene-tetrahydrofolate dehydrogenase/methenyl tetrahydrofolate cyclohydrolase
MKRELNGAELASFIMERQARQVRALKQAHHVYPRLTIFMSQVATDASEVYVRMKQRYAEDVGVVCDVVRVEENDMHTELVRANNDSNIHGIIIQLPLKDISQTEDLCKKIDSKKDVDGLGDGARFTGATAEAIDWLLAGYNVTLSGKKIALVGNGRLVGQPLERLWRAQGHDITIVDVDTKDARSILLGSDIVVSATGVAGRLTSNDIAQGAVVVDAGTASEDGKLIGDADETLRGRDDVTMTPIKGGVGPLTIAVLFDHVIQAAHAASSAAQQRD